MSLIEKALAKQKLAKKAEQETSEAQAKVVVETSATVPVVKPTPAQDKTETAPSHHIQLDSDSLVKRGYIFDGTSKRLSQEEYRGIKRKLLNNAFGPAAKTLKNSNLIMVSSSNPNEGKTFISINLALSIALEQDKTVLLIDADVLRPSINRELNFEMKKGLIEYLTSEVDDLSDIIYSTNIDNFKIIPAGKPHNLTNELLASDRMVALATELANRYPDRIVIFDCPPILGVTETPVLASLMGQAIVVVEESKTKVEDVARATSQLNEDLAIGIVMNKTLKSTKGSYGYYGYGYGNKD